MKQARRSVGKEEMVAIRRVRLIVDRGRMESGGFADGVEVTDGHVILVAVVGEGIVNAVSVCLDEWSLLLH